MRSAEGCIPEERSAFGAVLDPLASKGVACTGHCPPMRVHTLSETPRNAARRGPLLWSPRHPGIYIGPGVTSCGPPVGRPWVGCAVCHAHVRRGDCDAVRRSHKDVELTHLRLAASLPCPEGANHHIQPSRGLLVNVGWCGRRESALKKLGGGLC